jgi:prepilin-type processing-associated H-X9-DG protein
MHALGPPHWVDSSFQTFFKGSEILRPAQILVILDERSDTINDGYFAIDMSNTGSPDGAGTPNPYYIIDYPGSYHNSGGTVSFADGHVVSRKWVEPTTKPRLGYAGPRMHTSATDEDMRWLQGYSTYGNP